MRPSWPPGSEFWAGLLGSTVAAEDDFHVVLVDGAPRIACSSPLGTSRRTGRTARRRNSSNSTFWWAISRRRTPRYFGGNQAAARAAAGGGSPDDFQVYAEPAIAMVNPTQTGRYVLWM